MFLADTEQTMTTSLEAAGASSKVMALDKFFMISFSCLPLNSNLCNRYRMSLEMPITFTNSSRCKGRNLMSSSQIPRFMRTKRSSTTALNPSCNSESSKAAAVACDK